MMTAILAYQRTKYYFYAYYVLTTLTDMVCQGSINCLTLAYVADNIPESHRASAFGLLSGITSASFVFGTLTGRFLPTSATFQVSASIAAIAAIYMKTLLPDSNSSSKIGDDASCSKSSIRRPLKVIASSHSPQKKEILSRIQDVASLLQTSVTFTQAAIVSFFTVLGESGFQASLLYYLKARFHFGKDQFADLLLMSGVAAAISQLLIMPFVATKLGEEKLLRIGLLASCVHIFLYALSWANWVPYFASMFSIMFCVVSPCIRSIVSKQVGPDDQGKAQGCIAGICSFGNVISPLAFTPLTALFLSDRAPFQFPGFSIMCSGLVTMIAFLQSIMIRAAPPIPGQVINGEYLA